MYKEWQEINPYVRICVRTNTYPGWSLRNRVIYDHQFVLVSKGKGDVIIRDKTYCASKGDLFLIKPGVAHGFIADHKAPFEMLVIHFDFFYERTRNFWPHKKYQLGEGEKESDIPERHLLREIPMFEKNMEYPDYIRLQNYTVAEVIMKKLIEMNDKLLPGKELVVKSYFFELLYTIYVEAFCVSAHEGQAESFEKIKKAFEYINENYDKNIKIEELAEMCNLSTNYFSSLFKRQTTYAPKEYILRLRLEKAKSLLAQGGGTVGEICTQTGFGDIHYFSSSFKRYEGLSPSQYRAMVNGD